MFIKVMPTSRTELLFNGEFSGDGNKGYIFLSGTTESEQTSTLSLKEWATIQTL